MTDELRFAVAPVGAGSGGGFEVQIFVNGVEMCAAGAGLGMDPYAVLIPENVFVATDEAHTAPVARCGCGTYGCGETDIRISRDDGLVRWEWLKEVPIKRPVVFAAQAYDREVERVSLDRSWETPSRTAGRLVLTDASTVAVLAPHELSLDWVDTVHDDPSRFRVALRYRDTHQVFVDVAWAGRSPEGLAAAVIDTLSAPPADWRAMWHAMGQAGAPGIAGPGWSQHRF
jgi:hypothetical protein